MEKEYIETHEITYTYGTKHKIGLLPTGIWESIKGD